MGKQRRYSNSRRKAGVLSVVIPAFNVEEYLSDSLESVLSQQYALIEIIVVNDGSSDQTHAIAESWARKDRRVRVVHQENQGLSVARNRGVEVAAGEFLTFLDSDDVVEPGAYSSALDRLLETGSDFAVMSYQRDRLGQIERPNSRMRRAHNAERLGVNLESYPDIIVNVVAWTKIYRREFWDSAGIRFPAGRLYEDQATSMEAYAKARSFDVLDIVAVTKRIRSDNSSITQQLTTTTNVNEHYRASQDSSDALTSNGYAWVAPLRTVQTVNNNLSPFLLSVELMGATPWACFVGYCRYLADELEKSGLWDKVDVRNKVLTYLCAFGLREAAINFIRNRHGARTDFDGQIIGYGIQAIFSDDVEVRKLVPKEMLYASKYETPLLAAVIATQWIERGLRVEFSYELRRVQEDLSDVLVVSVIQNSEVVASLPTDRISAVPRRNDSNTSKNRYRCQREVVIPSWVLRRNGVYSLRLHVRRESFRRRKTMTVSTGLTLNAWHGTDSEVSEHCATDRQYTLRVVDRLLRDQTVG